MKINNPTRLKFPHVVNNSKELITFKNYLESMRWSRMNMYGIKTWRTDFEKALYPLTFIKTGPTCFDIIREY